MQMTSTATNVQQKIGIKNALGSVRRDKPSAQACCRANHRTTPTVQAGDGKKRAGHECGAQTAAATATQSRPHNLQTLRKTARAQCNRSRQTNPGIITANSTSRQQYPRLSNVPGQIACPKIPDSTYISKRRYRPLNRLNVAMQAKIANDRNRKPNIPPLNKTKSCLTGQDHRINKSTAKHSGLSMDKGIRERGQSNVVKTSRRSESAGYAYGAMLLQDRTKRRLETGYSRRGIGGAISRSAHVLSTIWTNHACGIAVCQPPSAHTSKAASVTRQYSHHAFALYKHRQTACACPENAASSL